MLSIAFAIATSGTLGASPQEPVIALDPGSTGSDLSKLVRQTVDGAPLIGGEAVLAEIPAGKWRLLAQAWASVLAPTADPACR